MTAAHLSRGAVLKGASVKMISRRPLQIRDFDTDPGWLGPKYLDDYYAETDPDKRIEIAREARGGGTIPPWIHNSLLDFANSDAIEILESMEVMSAQPKPSKGCLLKLKNGKDVYSDQVWIATGTCSSLQSMECLRPVLKDVSFIDGFPCRQFASAQTPPYLCYGPKRYLCFRASSWESLGCNPSITSYNKRHHRS